MADTMRTSGRDIDEPQVTPAEVAESWRQAEQAERIREYFRNLPGFLEMARQRREAAETADPSEFISLDEMKRKLGIED